MAYVRGRRRPNFAQDDRFDARWWGDAAGPGPPDHQWRSYMAKPGEVARVLLALSFPSHSLEPLAPTVMIWALEVREDSRLSGARIGTTIVNQLVDEHAECEIYVCATPSSERFWTRFGFSMCYREQCKRRGFILSRP